MLQGTILKIGDKVKHRTRPDVGIGQVVEIFGDVLCTVEFENCRFSEVPVDAFWTLKEIERKRQERDEKTRREQVVIEAKKKEKIKEQELESRRRRALGGRKKKLQEKKRIKERSNREIMARLTERGVSCFWHITHNDNLKNILRHGILNHYDAPRTEPNRVDISDPDAQRWREAKDPHLGRSIHSYAPLYINPRNPMLYVRRHRRDELLLLKIDLSVLFETEYLITDGNAASRTTKFYASLEHIDELPWNVLNSGYWPDHDDGKRKMCAEILVYPKVDQKYIVAVHCYSNGAQTRLANCGRKVLVTPKLFF